MFSNSLIARKKILDSIGTSFDKRVQKAVEAVVACIKDEKTLFFAGNGGSAAEAQHMSTEYLATLEHGNFRPGIKSIALTVNTSFLTAWTNDFGYEDIFMRQLQTLSSEGDLFFAYSTSGNSKNIIKAVEYGKDNGIKIIGFTGNDGGMLAKLSDISFCIPSQSTAMIQEIHTMLGHEICASVEKDLFFND